jgi:uncharacterized membrane protein YjjP (DUF1212 family)
MQPLEMALETALLVLRNGGSTAVAHRCFSNVLKGFDQDGVEMVWRFEFVAATKRVEGQSFTVVRTVGPVGTNLVRVSEAEALGERAARKAVDAATFASALERIEQLPSPYSRWVVTLVAAILSGCFSRLAGGDWGSFGVVFVAAGVGQSLRSFLQARKLAAAPVTLVCGVLSALIASAGLQLGLGRTIPGALLGSVIYMIPGLLLINGFMDVVVARYLLVGIERIVSAAFLFLVLAIAIVFARTLIP